MALPKQRLASGASKRICHVSNALSRLRCPASSGCCCELARDTAFSNCRGARPSQTEQVRKELVSAQPRTPLTGWSYSRAKRR